MPLVDREHGVRLARVRQPHRQAGRVDGNTRRLKVANDGVPYVVGLRGQVDVVLGQECLQCARFGRVGCAVGRGSPRRLRECVEEGLEAAPLRVRELCERQLVSGRIGPCTERDLVESLLIRAGDLDVQVRDVNPP